MVTEMISAGSTILNIHDIGDPKIADSKIWFGKISRAGIQILFLFFDLPKPVRNHHAIRLTMVSQAPANEKSRRKST